MSTPVSAFVTTYNNARTLRRCLQSVAWADEIVVLDSFSTDETPAIAKSFGARFAQHEFLGYGPQKQMALEMTRNHWVLLLDADEALSPESQEEIRALMEKGPEADGYTLPRMEQIFWRMAHPGTRHNHFLRLFDKRKGRISDMPIHAAPKVQGKIRKLRHVFYHFGEINIHTKVEKMNAYSTGLARWRLEQGKHPNLLWTLLYPPLFFLRQYLFKRQFLNGRAGLYNSIIAAFYAFLKNAKADEWIQMDTNKDPLIHQQDREKN